MPSFVDPCSMSNSFHNNCLSVVREQGQKPVITDAKLIIIASDQSHEGLHWPIGRCFELPDYPLCNWWIKPLHIF